MTWSRPLAVIRVFEQCAYGRFDGALGFVYVLRSDLRRTNPVGLRHADIFSMRSRAPGMQPGRTCRAAVSCPQCSGNTINCFGTAGALAGRKGMRQHDRMGFRMRQVVKFHPGCGACVAMHMPTSQARRRTATRHTGICCARQYLPGWRRFSANLRERPECPPRQTVTTDWHPGHTVLRRRAP